MKAKKHLHEKLIEEIFDEFKHIFHSSKQGVFIYLDLRGKKAEAALWKMQRRLSLISPRAGGNICFALPVYKNSVFRNALQVKGFKAVSPLQLYLDLVNYPMAGKEQAEWLKSRLAERGTPLIGPKGARG